MQTNASVSSSASVSSDLKALYKSVIIIITNDRGKLRNEIPRRFFEIRVFVGLLFCRTLYVYPLSRLVGHSVFRCLHSGVCIVHLGIGSVILKTVL